MEIFERLETVCGGRWLGISFLSGAENIPAGVKVRQVSRFCEAVKVASRSKMAVKPAEFTCPGASYAFGGMVDLNEAMIEKMVTLKGYAPDRAAALVEETPHLSTMPEVIAFDCAPQPDIYFAALQPAQVMRLMQLYGVKLAKKFQPEISSVISACGNTAVRAYEEQDVALSFGCDDSRAFGGLSRDRLYVALPYSLANEMTQ